MKVEFKKMYLDQYNLTKITKAVHNLFDDYNYKKAVAQEYLDSIYQHRLKDKPEDLKNKNNNDTTYSTVEKRDKVVKYINEFERKLEHLLSTLSPDEMIIYNYSIICREQDKQIRDRICKKHGSAIYKLQIRAFFVDQIRRSPSDDAVSTDQYLVAAYLFM